MSLAYKVEELLALRDSVSESAVSIDKFADEDVIKGQWASFTFTSHHSGLTAWAVHSNRSLSCRAPFHHPFADSSHLQADHTASQSMFSVLRHLRLQI
jgi:hypothetical protein